MHKHKLRKNMNVTEVRTHPEEIRMATDKAGGKTVAGYAVCWDSPSNDLGFIERIQKGAFTDSLALGEQRLLREHDPRLLLARVSSGTLTLKEDAKGLGFTATLPNSPIGEDTTALLMRGDLSSMSFGFRVLPNGETWGSEGKQVTRSITKASLSEVSIVSTPAYNSSSVSLRACPTELRSLLDEADAADDDECTCDCSECLAGDCSDCSNVDCDSADCVDCPMQAADDDPEDRSVAVEPEDLARYMRLQIALRR